MKQWLGEGQTAVITGGASGIGLAAARRYLEGGMNVVIADRDQDALEAAKSHLNAELHAADRLLAEPCDVTRLEQLERVRDIAIDRFGRIHCLMNNAGDSYRAPSPWEDAEAMRSLVDVNLWGVVHGCCAFIPSMLEHGEGGTVINTGSKQGITRPPGNIAYNVSKAGVLAYTEALAHAFRNLDNCRLSAHLLVPGLVYTGLVARYRAEKPPGAATPEETVAYMLEALERGDFYMLCPDNETTREMDEKRIQWTADDLIRNRPALSRWHPDFAGSFETFMKTLSK